VISRPQQTAVLPPMEEPDGSGRKVWLGSSSGILVVAVLAGGGYLLVSSLTNDNEAACWLSFPTSSGRRGNRPKPRLTDRGLNPVAKNRDETDPADADPGTVGDQKPKDGGRGGQGRRRHDLHRGGAQHRGRSRPQRDDAWAKRAPRWPPMG
jgi:hypothetical protein